LICQKREAARTEEDRARRLRLLASLNSEQERKLTPRLRTAHQPHRQSRPKYRQTCSLGLAPGDAMGRQPISPWGAIGFHLLRRARMPENLLPKLAHWACHWGERASSPRNCPESSVLHGDKFRKKLKVGVPIRLIRVRPLRIAADRQPGVLPTGSVVTPQT